METTQKSKIPSLLKDAISLLIFVACIAVGTLLINTFIFRSFSVVGPSMESTLYTGDHLLVNRIPVTVTQIQGKEYTPKRGQIIVFKNPNFTEGINDENEFVVKRVMAFSGERIKLSDGKYTIYNEANPKGFNPDDENHGEPGFPTSGSGDWIVGKGEIFVSGDHRQGNYSLDSRNGLGMIPLYDVIGPVSIRIFPFNKISLF
jgi:signal peptidase I